MAEAKEDLKEKLEKDLADLDFQIDDERIKELNGEGFTNSMIWSFLKTAENTKTIVSSRLPGGAGKDLIAAGYDLKGFQIKSKSCDWGPMAGFLCQLPFFNKKGYENVSYNTGHIMHYLECLAHFSGNKGKIREIEGFVSTLNKKVDAVLLRNTPSDIIDKVLDPNDPTLTNPDLRLQFPTVLFTAELNQKIDNFKEDAINAKKTRLKNIINKKYYAPIRNIQKSYKEKEQEKGEWSGENTIEGDKPFIHLKRFADKTQAEVIAILRQTNGINPASVIAIGDMIYGTAQNQETEIASTVFIDFLLKQDENIWAIYHGKIEYKETTTANKKDYPTSILGCWNLLDDDLKEKYPIGGNGDGVISIPVNKNKPDGSIEVISNEDLLTLTFQFAEGGIEIDKGQEKVTFYPIQGFQNPHPPYKLAELTFYKNAVSGDYDLFAFWPNTKIAGSELTRLTEYYLNTNLKLFWNANSAFCVEFIPGLGEINPPKTSSGLKESAERGNISALGETVAQNLNNFALAIDKQKITNLPKSGLNKAFHSDEGGRPGVMEIEFPIAIFFPKAITTTALNNQYGANNSIPAFAARQDISTKGGLIKTPEELLQLMIDCKEAGYIVMMQSEWMMHLFYISMAETNRANFRAKTGIFNDVAEDNPNPIFPFLRANDENDKPILTADQEKQQTFIDKKLKEFVKIEENHNKIYGNPPTFDQAAFEQKLKDFLGLATNQAKFIRVRNEFLKLAFRSKRKAGLRKIDIERILYDIEDDTLEGL